jgi:hypothetical protein
MVTYSFYCILISQVMPILSVFFFFSSGICPFVLYLNEMLNFLFLRTRAFMFSKDDKGEKEGSTAVVETASQFFYFILFYFFTYQKEL